MLEINNRTKQKINQAKTKRLAEEFLREYKQKNKEVSLALLGATAIRRLNNDYRGINKATDVLSFNGTGNYLGEVVINMEEVRRADKYLEVFGLKKSAEYIFYFLLIHGLLHLVGFNDEKETERLKMIKRGEEFLERYL